MSITKKIDVFIPVYNDQQYIGRAIQSCLDQIDVDVRVLVSDNCSTDGTFEIVQAFAENDHRVKLYRNQKNIGLTGNMKKAYELVTRDFYMLLCSDDFLLDRYAFPTALQLFGKYPNLVSVYSNIDFVDSNGKLILTNRFKRGEVFDAEPTMRHSLISTRNKFGIPLLHKTEYAKRYRYLDKAAYTNDLWHSYKVGQNGQCGHIDRSYIANTYSGNNLTLRLMNKALGELRYLAKLEDISLPQAELYLQLFNHCKTMSFKLIFFKFVLPIKMLINQIVK